MAGIYVHVPFCHAKCAYCDFYSVADPRGKAEYVEAVGKEYAVRRKELDGHIIETLYFGGGTPSILSAEEFGRLASFFPRTLETTIEVNPEDVNPENIEAWRQAGVNRISMGVQSLVDAELRAVRRRHSAADVYSAIEYMKRGDIDNISCDLIYGLPGQTAETWRYSVKSLLDNDIKHLSAYTLTYEDGTLITLQRDRGIVREAPEELTDEMYHDLCEIASEYGFEHYEISNFAAHGFRSRHNSSYWESIPYLGLGPGAHSLDNKGIRRFVQPSVKKYLLNPADAAVIDEESDIDRINDRIMVSLRTSKGLNLYQFDESTRAEILSNARTHFKMGNLIIAENHIIIPESRWLLADSVIRDLFL